MKLRHPSNIVVSGPTGCGKTQWVIELLEKRSLAPFPQRIIWVYGEWQAAYERVRKQFPEVEFVNGYQDWIYNTLDPKVRNLLVLDDQMDSMGDNRALSKLFTQGSHHRNLTIIFILQNSYHQGKSMRDAITNSQYRVYFENHADKLQEKTDAQRAYPNQPRYFTDSKEDACSVAHGYLLRDMRSGVRNELRLRTNIFGDEVVYVPREVPPETVVEVEADLV